MPYFTLKPSFPSVNNHLELLNRHEHVYTSTHFLMFFISTRHVSIVTTAQITIPVYQSMSLLQLHKVNLLNFNILLLAAVSSCLK